MEGGMKLKSTTAGGIVIVVSLLAWMAINAARPRKERTIMVNKSTPILHVKSIEPSLKFWTDRFGFKKTIEVPEGDHLGFVAIENDAVEVMYQTYAGMKSDPTNPLAKAADQGPSFLFMEVPDISAISDALRGAEIVQPLHESPYGAKEIVIREPGGHFVIFSQL